MEHHVLRVVITETGYGTAKQAMFPELGQDVNLAYSSGLIRVQVKDDVSS